MPKLSKPYSRLEGMAEHLTDVREDFGAEPDPDRGLPDIVRPFKSRPVFLILGMYGSGASLVAQMLQLLGVDMVEGEPANDDKAPGGAWERPEIVSFNDRLLEALGRPLNSSVHALPFAAGWWADPKIRTIKREIQEYLQSSLSGSLNFWGFKDLRITRLLPLWQQVFDELGLHPIYLWTVRDPAESTASTTLSGLAPTPAMAEVMWFIYNSEICKYVGKDAAAIIDYKEWTRDPDSVVQTLLSRLPLNWRGSEADLLECVRAIAPTENRHRGASRPNSPLIRSFYESIRSIESPSERARFQASVIQAVDIVRSLITPYASLVGRSAGELTHDKTAASPHEDQSRLPALERELEGALRIVQLRDAEIARLAKVARSTSEPATVERVGVLEQQLKSAVERAEASEAATVELEQNLNNEIEARIAENAWLRRNYEERLEAQTVKLAEAEKLVSELSTQREQLQLDLAERDEELRGALKRVEKLRLAAETTRQIALTELDQVKHELAVQKTANEKYLARIYELRASQQALAANAKATGPAAPSNK
jgi:hypothetical protein